MAPLRAARVLHQIVNPAAEILHEKGFQASIDLDQPYNSPEISASSPFPPLGVPAPLSEGILYDCVEIFKGSGGWSEAHAALGFKVHDGFDIDSRRIRISDLDQPSTCHELIALAWRRVVRAWHAGVPCLTETSAPLQEGACRVRSKRASDCISQSASS